MCKSVGFLSQSLQIRLIVFDRMSIIYLNVIVLILTCFAVYQKCLDIISFQILLMIQDCQ